MKKPKRDKPQAIPTRDDIVAFIRTESEKPNVGKIGTREIARAFGLKNADRAALKRILRELEGEGTLARRRGKIHQTGELPPVTVLDIIARDANGELIGVPSEWDEDKSGTPPRVIIATSTRAHAGAQGTIGDRALVRVARNADDAENAAYTGRIIKVLDRARQRLLGIFRALPDGSGRMVPVDKKQVGRELTIAKDDAGGAQDGDLIAVDLVRTRGYGLPQGRVKERLTPHNFKPARIGATCR